jgi:hypothetical protein
MRLIDLNDLAIRPQMAASVPRNELVAERARIAACAAALDSVIASAPPEPVAQTEDGGWLELDVVLAKHPGIGITRRWLFANAEECAPPKLPFLKRLSRKGLLVNENGLKRWLSGRRTH